MDSLLKNRTIRRYVRNTRLAQKRFEDARALTDEDILEWIMGVSIDMLRTMYVNDNIDLETFEQLLTIKMKGDTWDPLDAISPPTSTT